MARKYLVVANQTLGGRHLVETVIDRSREGADIHVTVPATPVDPAESSSGDTAESIAQRRLDEKLRRLEAAGVHATGNVGPADPLEAIREQLAGSDFSGMIISTLPHTISRWLHLDLPHQAAREFGLPVEWLESHGDDDNPVTVHIVMPPAAAPNVSPSSGIPPLRTH